MAERNCASYFSELYLCQLASVSVWVVKCLQLDASFHTSKIVAICELY